MGNHPSSFFCDGTADGGTRLIRIIAKGWTALQRRFDHVGIVNLTGFVMPIRPKDGTFYDGTAALNMYRILLDINLRLSKHTRSERLKSGAASFGENLDSISQTAAWENGSKTVSPFLPKSHCLV
jgi:hypothetical protein